MQLSMCPFFPVLEIQTNCFFRLVLHQVNQCQLGTFCRHHPSAHSTEVPCSTSDNGLSSGLVHVCNGLQKAVHILQATPQITPPKKISIELPSKTACYSFKAICQVYSASKRHIHSFLVSVKILQRKLSYNYRVLLWHATTTTGLWNWAMTTGCWSLLRFHFILKAIATCWVDISNLPALSLHFLKRFLKMKGDISICIVVHWYIYI